MLERHQILLTAWQIEYARFLSEKYDISLSESVRALLCTGIIHSVSKIYPEFKPRYSIKGTVDTLKKVADGKVREEMFHKVLSGAYFDARKAAELRLSREKKKK
jgi:hypothetical protein